MIFEGKQTIPQGGHLEYVHRYAQIILITLYVYLMTYLTLIINDCIQMP
jgi:hypothetical protein